MQKKKYEYPSLFIDELDFDAIIMYAESDDDFVTDKIFEDWD